MYGQSLAFCQTEKFFGTEFEIYFFHVGHGCASFKKHRINIEFVDQYSLCDIGRAWLCRHERNLGDFILFAVVKSEHNPGGCGICLAIARSI